MNIVNVDIPKLAQRGKFQFGFCKQYVTTVTFRRTLLILFPLFLISKPSKITRMTGSLKIAIT